MLISRTRIKFKNFILFKINYLPIESQKPRYILLVFMEASDLRQYTASQNLKQPDAVLASSDLLIDSLSIADQCHLTTLQMYGQAADVADT